MNTDYLEIQELSQEEIIQIRDDALDVVMACDSRLLFMHYFKDAMTGRCYNA